MRSTTASGRADSRRPPAAETVDRNPIQVHEFSLFLASVVPVWLPRSLGTLGLHRSTKSLRYSPMRSRDGKIAREEITDAE